MKNVIWSLINSFSNQGLVAIFSIILGNIVSPHDLGVYITIMIVISYGVSFFSLELGGGIVQKLNNVNLKDKGDQYFTTGFVLVLVTSVAAIFLAYIAKDLIIDIFGVEKQKDLLFFSIPLIFFNMIHAYFNRVLQANLKLKHTAIINMAASILQISICLILFYYGYKLYAIFISYYISLIIAIAGMGFIVFKTYRFTITSQFTYISKDLLKFSLLLQISTIAIFLDKSIDIFFVNYYLSKDQVSIYNYALKFAMILLIIGNSISVVNYPKFTRIITSDSKESIEQLFSKSLNFSFFTLSILSMALIIHSKYIICLILPPVYQAMVPALTLLLTSIAIFSSWVCVAIIITSKGIPQFMAVLNWSALLLNILLNMLLIPRLGIIGAAIATSSSFIFRMIAGIIVVHYKVKINYNYLKLVTLQIIFVCFIVVEKYILDTALIYKELLLFIYTMFAIMLLIGRAERNYIGEQINKYSKCLYSY